VRSLTSLLLLLLLQAEARYRELTGLGLNVNLVLVGNKGKQYFSRRPQYNIVSEYTPAASPKTGL
jgi:F0F1-type ATP synthase gamma subunit